MNPKSITHTPSKNKYLVRLSSLTLALQPVKKENFEYKTTDLYFKIDRVSHFLRVDRLVNISSSSYRAGSTDILDPLSPLLPIVHRPR